MIGLDTNILVRYIVQDDPKQSQKATDFIQKNCSIISPGFINSLVICELIWVLESAYNYSRDDIVSVIEKILRIRQFQIHEPEHMWSSLQKYKEKIADFSDCYIASINAEEGCNHTVTFDKKAARLTNMLLI